MSLAIKYQQLLLDLDDSILVEEFIKLLNQFPGLYVRCPMPIHKGETIEEWETKKSEITRQTSEILTMMGIKHTRNPTTISLTEEDPNGDY